MQDKVSYIPRVELPDKVKPEYVNTGPNSTYVFCFRHVRCYNKFNVLMLLHFFLYGVSCLSLVHGTVFSFVPLFY